MKSNDNIPHDEMLLAEALAAAKRSRVYWAAGHSFVTDTGRATHDIRSTHGETVVAVCAVGALYLAGRWDGNRHIKAELRFVSDGNDRRISWRYDAPDCGESLGWAFRCAMETP